MVLIHVRNASSLWIKGRWDTLYFALILTEFALTQPLHSQ